jgi:hypothetical protein
LCFFDGDAAADGEAESRADALGEPGPLGDADDEELEFPEPVVESEDVQPAARRRTVARQRTSMRQRLMCSVVGAMEPWVVVVEPRWSVQPFSSQSDARSWEQSERVGETIDTCPVGVTGLGRAGAYVVGEGLAVGVDR